MTTESICVTGSSGFIGRHLVEGLRDKWPDALITCCDTDEGLDCRSLFQSDQTFDVVIHCAAITGGIEGTTGNAAFQGSMNAQMDGAFFEWALRTKPGRILYFSSSCAYPLLSETAMGYQRTLREQDLRFDHLDSPPDNLYGWVKLVGEVLANGVRDAGIPVSIIRPFAVYGEDQELCRMIPMFVHRALQDSDEFETWGPGWQASDFIHIDDVVNAIIIMLDNGIDGPINLGTGRGVSVDEAAQIVMDAAGISRPVVRRMDKPYGPLWRVADPTLLETFYTPKITLEEGVRRAIEFHRNAVPTSYGLGDDLA